jgi:hypothetical protein
MFSGADCRTDLAGGWSTRIVRPCNGGVGFGVGTLRLGRELELLLHNAQVTKQLASCLITFFTILPQCPAHNPIQL